MKYAILTPFTNIITEDLRAEILSFANQDPELLDITSYSSNSVYQAGKLENLSNNNANDELKYTYQSSDIDRGPGDFMIIKPSDDLESRLLARLPDKIRSFRKQPYVRIQRLQNYMIIPHIDFTRNLGFILPITSNPTVYTVFYEKTQPHDFYREHLPDPDLIAEKCRVRFDKDETWLIDTDSIHGTDGIDTNVRVTVNFMWSDVTMLEIMSTIFSQ